jgi:[ribosomal protein S18]-alanine N-acetyltransferase
VDPDALADLFAELDPVFFHPHPLDRREAERIAAYSGKDVYLVSMDGDRAVAYGMLRGYDQGYEVPSLGIAVRSDAYRQGHGRAMMERLHDAARTRGSRLVRLRVDPTNEPAKALYRSMGYILVAYERDEEVMVLIL